MVDFGSRKLRLVEERLLTSHFFTHVLNAPPESEWYGDDGTIHLIMEELSIHRGNYRKVKRVITQTWNCLQSNRCYLGRINWKGGHQTLIQKGSHEEQLVAEFKEKGLSFTHVKEHIMAQATGLCG